MIHCPLCQVKQSQKFCQTRYYCVTCQDYVP